MSKPWLARINFMLNDQSRVLAMFDLFPTSVFHISPNMRTMRVLEYLKAKFDSFHMEGYIWRWIWNLLQLISNVPLHSLLLVVIRSQGGRIWKIPYLRKEGLHYTNEVESWALSACLVNIVNCMVAMNHPSTLAPYVRRRMDLEFSRRWWWGGILSIRISQNYQMRGILSLYQHHAIRKRDGIDFHMGCRGDWGQVSPWIFNFICCIMHCTQRVEEWYVYLSGTKA